MSQTKGDNTMQVVRIDLDIAKNSFQVHGVDVHGKVVIREQLNRGEGLSYFAQLPSCLVGLEACGGAHYWVGARTPEAGARRTADGRSRDPALPHEPEE